MNTELDHTADAISGSLLRSRAVTWQEPEAGIRKGAAMSGLDYLLAMKSGELPKPPIKRKYFRPPPSKRPIKGRH